ncbi:MAG: DMT family transporter, partial [Bacteroidota bacterium]
MSIQTKALIAIAIAAALWGSAGATSKTLFIESSPFVAASHRFLLASFIILPFFLRAKKQKGYLIKLLPLGLFNTGNVLFYYLGLSHTTANTASIIGTAAPLTTMLLSWFLIKERIGKEKIIGILVGLMGALFIVLLPMIEKG